MAKKQTPLPPAQHELFRASDFIEVDPKVADLMVIAEKQLNNAVSMSRYAMLHPSTVFEMMRNVKNTTRQEDQTNLIGTDLVATPKRLLSFESNMKCVCCGREGNAFLVERHNNDRHSRHLNLYAITKNEIVLMTVDHILPDSLGGRYDEANFQTMCRPCNQKKQNIMSAEEVRLVRESPTTYCKSWVYLPYLHVHLDLQDMMRNATKENAKRLTATFDAWRKKQRHSTHEKESKQITAEFRAAIERAWIGPMHKNQKVRPSWIKRMMIGIRRFHTELKPIVTRLRADLRKAHSRSFAR